MKKKKNEGSLLKFFQKLGPGLITGASDDDPSGIATYSQAGAQFGLQTLWTALFTFPLMVVMQGIAARIGKVTARGLIYNIRENYPSYLLYFILLCTVPAMVLNISANLAGMGAVAHLVVPFVPAPLFSVFFTAILLIAMIFLSYEKIVSVMKYLCLSLLLYLLIPFLVKEDLLAIIKYTLLPHIHWTKEYLAILVAILGTTISPYLFFWQATMEAEEKRKKAHPLFTSRRELAAMNKDIGAGMFVSNLVMYFILLTTGSVLHPAGITHIQTVEQAAEALKPLAGQLSYILFALGIIGTGFLGIPVLGGCISYSLTTTFRWKGGLDESLSNAKGFYAIIITALVLALCINFIGIDPIDALLVTAILYGVTAPVLIAVILHIANNRKIMGRFVNGFWQNCIGLICFLLMLMASLALILQFL